MIRGRWREKGWKQMWNENEFFCRFSSLFQGFGIFVLFFLFVFLTDCMQRSYKDM